MSQSQPRTERLLRFEASDGAALAGDLVVPDSPRAAVVLCHPHPKYGGNRHNPVIAALHAALPRAGIASMRFDFRAEFGDGVGERLDALAAFDLIAREVSAAPTAVVGYSFGAWIALQTSNDNARDVAAVVAIAPPLAVMAEVARPVTPALVLTPAHDQFSDPAHNGAVVQSWRTDDGPRIDHSVIPMADHFLAGSATLVAQQTTDWLTTQLPAARAR